MRDRGLVAFTLLDPDNPLLAVDLLADPPAMFDELWQRAVHMRIGDVDVPVVSLDDLASDHARGGDPTGGWEAHEAEQRRAWLQTSPAQRLAWLEQAIAFAHQAGALPRHDPADDAASEKRDRGSG